MKTSQFAKNLVSSLHLSSFSNNVLKLVGGTVFAQLINVIGAPLLARIFSPKDFGTSAVFVSIATVFGVIICLRYELAVMLPESNEEAVNVVALSIGSVLIVTTLLGVLLFLFQDPLLDFLNAKELRPYLWMVPLALFVNGVQLALNYWNTRTRHFTRLSIMRVAGALTTNISQGTLGLTGQPNSGGLIIGTVAGWSAASIVLGRLIWRDDRELFIKNVRFNKIIESLKRYRKFPLVDSWGGFINNLSWQLPALLLSIYFSPVIVGYYALAYRLIKMPMSLIGSSIGQVFYQAASEARGNFEDLSRVVEEVFRRLTALGLFPAFLATIAGKELIIVLLGKNWAESGVYLQILGPWMFFWFISSPLSYIFTMFEKQELALIVHTSILMTRFVSLIIGGLLKNAYIALGLFSASGVLVYGGLAFWNLMLAKLSFRTILLVLMKYGAIAAIPLGLVLAIKTLAAGSPWMVVLASVTAGFLYYLLILGDMLSWKFDSLPAVFLPARKIRRFIRTHLVD